jgi:hypothetical protein
MFSYSAGPRDGLLVGLGDSDLRVPTANDLDLGFVLMFAARVVLGNGNRGFNGDGLAGVDTRACVSLEVVWLKHLADQRRTEQAVSSRQWARIFWELTA